MTFSIVGRDAKSGELGVAVASKYLAVGAAVPAARIGVGAVATQAYPNTLYRRDGLALLAHHHDATSALESLLAGDELRSERQVGIVDADGGSATYTGPGCFEWAGGLHAEDVAIQGNILVGEDVIRRMHEAWHAHADLDLAHRLMRALTAGDEAGGDRRGRQSAALLVVSTAGLFMAEDDLAYDLRVDDHPAPVAELQRLLDLHDLHFGEPEELLPLAGELETEVSGHLTRLGYDSLDDWAGVENFELRLRPGKIDAVLLDLLRRS